jgi:hypothetical protein
VRDDLYRVEAPVKILMGNGTWDGGTSDLEADRSLRLIRERISGVEVEIVEGAHPGYVPIQEPQRCAASVSEFVARHH